MAFLSFFFSFPMLHLLAGISGVQLYCTTIHYKLLHFVKKLSDQTLIKTILDTYNFNAMCYLHAGLQGFKVFANTSWFIKKITYFHNSFMICLAKAKMHAKSVFENWIAFYLKGSDLVLFCGYWSQSEKRSQIKLP